MWCNTRIGTEVNSTYESYYIKFAGDTTINEEGYKFIMRSDDQNHENWYYYGLIMEDSINGQVYLYDKTSETKSLLYDFGLEQGDSIESYGENYVVDTVIYQTFGSIGELSKHIFFENGRVWIKGVGSLRGVLEGVPNLPLSTGATLDLVCFYENDEKVYQNARYNDCYVNTTAVTTLEDQAKFIEVFPSDIGILTIRTSNNKQGEFMLFDLEGRNIIKQDINIIETQLCLQQSGVFIYRFTSNEGEIQTGKVYVK
ncbi:MAG: hypothetical protein PF486_02255 [Prolixibacteraceae bacterium]|nr:hypothetical protein [Prolixibacteraceae bacterium]